MAAPELPIVTTESARSSLTRATAFPIEVSTPLFTAAEGLSSIPTTLGAGTRVQFKSEIPDSRISGGTGQQNLCLCIIPPEKADCFENGPGGVIPAHTIYGNADHTA